MSRYVKPYATKTLLLLALSWMLGCQSTGTIVIDNCAAFDLIYPSRADSTETLRQVLNHNQTYEAICPMGAIDSEQKHQIERRQRSI